MCVSTSPYWLHKSKGPQLSTPRETAELLQYLQPYLSIEEGRDVAGRILGTPLEELKEAGLDRPLAIIQPAPSQQEATPQQQQHAGKQGALKEK